VDQANKMQAILSVYEIASSQALNPKKLEFFFFSRNVLTTNHNNVASILGVKAVLGTGKYFGLPFYDRQEQKIHFQLYQR
jgi:hypothetical protein